MEFAESVSPFISGYSANHKPDPVMIRAYHSIPDYAAKDVVLQYMAEAVSAFGDEIHFTPDHKIQFRGGVPGEIRKTIQRAYQCLLQRQGQYAAEARDLMGKRKMSFKEAFAEVEKKYGEEDKAQAKKGANKKKGRKRKQGCKCSLE